MTADAAARLRQLAQDHHDGRLDLKAYRSLRAPLLDALVSGASAAVVAASSAALEVTQPRAVAPAASRPTPVAEPRRSPPMGVIVTLIAVVLVAAAVTLWTLRSHPSTVATGVVPGAPTAPDQILSLITPFMDRGDWSDASLTGLNASLLELGSARIAAVAHDARFQRFVDELRARLKEQQALSTTPLTADNSPLAALAVTIGIDLNSPDSALHISPLPPPPPAPAGPGGVPPAAPVRAVQRPSGPQHASEASPPPTAASPLAASATPTAPTSTVAPATAVAQARPSTCRLELIGTRRPLCHDTIAEGVEGPSLALVPAGSFSMGSTAAPEEQPVHTVSLSAPFAISVYEVSQGEFKQFCEQARRPCPSQPWPGDDYPVVNVSWDDARAYTEWLSATTGHHYALPTEAQWEYAARAGHTGLFPSGDALSPTDAQFSGSTRQTAPAPRSQTFNANPFRLLHTVGNVREWVADAWLPNFANAPSDGSAVKAQATTRVARGGSYADGASRLRLSLREGLPASTRDTTTGFRIVREVP